MNIAKWRTAADGGAERVMYIERHWHYSTYLRAYVCARIRYGPDEPSQAEPVHARALKSFPARWGNNVNL